MGRVQGVGFRWSTQRFAKNAGVSGYVKNLNDGSLELVICGDEKQLNEVVDWIEKGGPMTARIDDYKKEDIEVDYNVFPGGFEIV